MTSKPEVPSSPLLLAGLQPGDEQVYRRLLRATVSERERLTEVLGLPMAELDEVLARFEAAGLVHLVGDEVRVEPPLEVLAHVAEAETERLRAEYEAVEAFRRLIPGLVLEHSAATRQAGVGTVDVEAVGSSDISGLFRGLIEESTGDLLWLRPDQWRLPVSSTIDPMVLEALRAGRGSRAVYPTRALEEAPQVLRARAEAGEQLRVVASIPTRIAIFGGTAALIPDRWGENSGRRLVVREHALVGALTALFEQVWERAMTVPGLGGEPAEGVQRLLLVQLAHGAKDEQIARALGISLRTVRRRVADMMAELGAESRFQAGVEAVRRGWI
ncbi:MAG TPA: helix-turn-helix domain-containing protein [Nocardioidaceae bacterium]|nr:helix-turn-helix domain-containing protein [Nocardioidaceae bacterium]